MLQTTCTRVLVCAACYALACVTFFQYDVQPTCSVSYSLTAENLSVKPILGGIYGAC